MCAPQWSAKTPKQNCQLSLRIERAVQSARLHLRPPAGCVHLVARSRAGICARARRSQSAGRPAGQSVAVAVAVAAGERELGARRTLRSRSSFRASILNIRRSLAEPKINSERASRAFVAADANSSAGERESERERALSRRGRSTRAGRPARPRALGAAIQLITIISFVHLARCIPTADQSGAQLTTVAWPARARDQAAALHDP